MRRALGAVLLAAGLSSGCVHSDAVIPEVVSVSGAMLGSRIHVVPVTGGVVLVDAGVPEDREAVEAVLAERQVLAILLTHGHVDHAAGIGAWPGVPVYLHEADVDRLFGPVPEEPFVPRVGWRLQPRPTDRGRIHPVRDGDVIRQGGEDFEVVHLPGHTAGSVTWKWGDVLFTGDTLLGSPMGLTVSTWFYSDDIAQAWHSLQRLDGRNYRYVIDGHHGRWEVDPRQLSARFDGDPPADPIHGFIRPLEPPGGPGGRAP